MGDRKEREDWREREALFRYGLIREAADERLSPRERGALVRALAGRPVAHPAGPARRSISGSGGRAGPTARREPTRGRASPLPG